MRVICIDAENAPTLKHLEVYTVIHQRINVDWGTLGYKLLEAQTSDPLQFTEYFNASRFAPLSEIDEIKFERNYQKELA